MAEARSPRVMYRALVIPGRKPRGEWMVESIDVGTRSTCALVLNDPVVAERHCAFHFRDGRFFLEDLGSVSGTWHNGVEVVAPIEVASGDSIVIGVSRLVVQIKREADALELEIAVEESSFHYRRAGPDNFKGPRENWTFSDADRWVQSEVRFGRIPAVRAASWSAVLVAIVTSSWLLFTRSGELSLQPGVLAGNHARLVQDCAACHGSGDAASTRSCVTCHSDMFPSRHPFLDGSPDADHAGRGITASDRACLMCHAAHHELPVPAIADGANEQLVHAVYAEPAKDFARARIDHPEDGSLPQVCSNCHDEAPQASVDSNMSRVLELAATLGANESASAPHAYDFERFSHKDHLGVSGGMACALCHDAAVPVGGAPAASAEFAAVSFEHCARCHVESIDESTIPSALVEVVRSSRRLLAEKHSGGLLAMSWHGSDSGACTQCHESAQNGGLRKAQREVITREFDFRTRSHAEQANAFVGKKGSDCRECHAELATLDGGEALRKPFLHAAHAVTLFPKTATEIREGARDCAACHLEQWSSRSTSAAARLPLEDACRTCHASTSADDSGIPVAHELERKTRDTVEFSHEQHMGVQDSCFSCHEFKFEHEGASDEDPRAAPVLKPDVASCTACHGAHRNIQKDSCAYCHGADPTKSGNDDARLYRGERYERSDWPAALLFSHFSGGNPARGKGGHRALVFGEDGEPRCFSCHDEQNLRVAERTSDVAIPDGRGMQCLQCHALEGTWFHWQLPLPPK